MSLPFSFSLTCTGANIVLVNCPDEETLGREGGREGFTLVENGLADEAVPETILSTSSFKFCISDEQSNSETPVSLEDDTGFEEGANLLAGVVVGLLLTEPCTNGAAVLNFGAICLEEAGMTDVGLAEDAIFDDVGTAVVLTTLNAVGFPVEAVVTVVVSFFAVDGFLAIAFPVSPLVLATKKLLLAAP